MLKLYYGNMQVVKGKVKGYGLPADIWSLGCTVLEMLTGQIPYYPMECVRIRLAFQAHNPTVSSFYHAIKMRLNLCDFSKLNN